MASNPGTSVDEALAVVKRGADELLVEAELIRRGSEVRARGRLRAEVTQSCVASGEPVSDVVRRERESAGPPE